MDHTKCKVFIGFRHTEDKHTYWINSAWTYDQEIPGLFPYNSKEDKAIVEDVANSLQGNWKIKDLEMVTFNVVSSMKLNGDGNNVKRRGRKPKNLS